jgi:curli biogenesis system outer membrane secretion channel CsgG
MKKNIAITLVTAALLAGCATESHQSLEVAQTVAAKTAGNYQGVKANLAIGQFVNKSSFNNGVFSDGSDQLGSQAKTILLTHLQQTGRFNMMDRANLAELQREAGFNKQTNHIKGAKYIITGDVTEFGRKTVGDQQLFGILGRGKTQVAYSKVSLNVVDVQTSQVIYSAQGAGEYSLSNREIIGFGGSAGYDSTLNGKVLDLAIRNAVDNLVKGIANGAWQPTQQ